jgi:hypothetical protein
LATSNQEQTKQPTPNAPLHAPLRSKFVMVGRTKFPPNHKIHRDPSRLVARKKLSRTPPSL